MQKGNNKTPGVKILSLVMAGFVFMSSFPLGNLVFGAEPLGNDWFQIRSNPFTGKDDTGDGGTGSSADLNYFYVDQSFDGMIELNSAGTTAANIWVDLDPALVQPSNLTSGSYFNSWRKQSVDPNRIKSTGYNYPVVMSTGKGNFSSAKFKMLKPSEANYGLGSPAVLDINTGTIGITKQSNIANNGTDLLDSAEDFRFHIWADTKKPYAKNPLPVNGAVNVPVDSLYAFDLRDSLKGETDDLGVGTGVNINTAGADIMFNSVSLKASSTNVCTGIWGSNLCTVTVNAPVATAYPGDTRKWSYNTTYTVLVSGYKDLASSNQSQLGDANGPNIMDSKSFTFTTAVDAVAPQLSNVSPLAGATDQPVNSVISFDVTDRAVYPNGMSGSGIKAGSCRVDVSSITFPLKTYKAGDTGVTATDIDYGRRLVVDPSPDFASGETITVRIYSCEDNAGNKAAERNFTFKIVVLDTDNDGILDSADNCKFIPNPSQLDTDKDGMGDACDPDKDNDGVLNETDNCPLIQNPQQKDIDNDGIGDVCDDDNDNDGIKNDVDNCPLVHNPYQIDTDKDGLGDACDSDADGDTILNDSDNCPLLPNTDQKDTDNDKIGDVCDPDADGDTILNDSDNCPLVPNTKQEDLDKDGIGDVCDDDIDNDTIKNLTDNCVYVPNLDQKDTDKNGIGDVCEVVQGAIDYNIKGKPQKRVVIGGVPYLNLNSNLSFYNRITKKTDWSDKVVLGGDGTVLYPTNKLSIGDYDIALKGESHLTKIVRNIGIGPMTTKIDLDYTFGNTFELIAGDLYSDNYINSFDLATMLLTYSSRKGGFADLTKDGTVNAMDLALLIINYFKKGDAF